MQVGSVIRAVRIRRGMRQADVAVAAGVSPAAVSLIEHGGLERTSLRAVRRVAAALGMSIPFAPRWRCAELAKLLDERHAALVRAVIARLASQGWEARPEHTFAVYGERGSIDVLAWHAGHRALLVVEVKTGIVDLQDTLSTMDRKRRLAPLLARELGWKPALIGIVLVVPAETQARHAIAAYKAVFDAAYPAGTLQVRRWLRQPERDLRGIWFMLNSSPGGANHRRGGSMRVRSHRAVSREPAPRSAEGGSSQVRPDRATPEASSPRLHRPGRS